MEFVHPDDRDATNEAARQLNEGTTVEQSPLAGETAKLKDAIYLTTSLVAAKKGVKKVVVSNQSNTARPMNLWLYESLPALGAIVSGGD